MKTGSEQHLFINQVPKFPMKSEYSPQSTSKTTSCNVHVGQRKLLMSEIHFLTDVHRNNTAHNSMLCVYAGACPCTHMSELLEMFPNIFFLLIDPAFKKKDQVHLNHPRVSVCPYNFKDDTVDAITTWIDNTNNDNHWIVQKLNKLCSGRVPISPDGENLLFISDIRRMPYDETHIAFEMRNQENWFTKLGACAGLLKFRLPFTNKVTMNGMQPVQSLDGDLCLPIWGPPSTTECRLLVRKGAKTKIYYPVEHEKTMAGFNTIERPKQWFYRKKMFNSFDEFAEFIVMEAYDSRYVDPYNNYIRYGHR
jgi:cap2 methyltransferase